ncbi:hypothetical protein [Hydrogenophaga sp. 2FB]|uniref:hypothetical protein n=1 Tax=Hydrogenophaga sp. 2FB TaxID=2502187 RepID=UPI0010F6B54D|nr:hypothetical protein [Hydrogenophaga sp. 2FB]
MSDDKPIRVRRSELPYGIVPQSLIEDSRLSTTARVIAVWFCVQSSNWELRVNHMRKVLAIGKDADLAARRQLKQFGYLQVNQKTKAGGVFAYLEYEFDPSPQLVGSDSATVGGFSAAGSPAAGSTDGGQASYLTRTSETTQEEQKQPPPQAKAARPPGGGDLIFPGGLGEADQAACMQIMRAARIDSGTQQEVLDELQGTLRSGRAVAKPAAWVRRLVGLHLAGSLVLEHAPQVAEARRSRAAHLARLADLAPTSPTTGTKPPLDMDNWRKKKGIPPRRTRQLRERAGTSP